MNDHNGKQVPGGRGLYDFALITDTYGSEIRVRTSSIAAEPCIWIFSMRDGKEYTEHHLHGIQAISPHLNVEQAKRLRDALQKFIDGVEKEA